MSAQASSALVVRSTQPPLALPQTLKELEPPLFRSELLGDSKKPLTLFLTVDVEDSYFDRPILMSGEGIGREFGIFGILDQLDLRNLKATFFVNVYEKDRQPAGVVERVVREIATRGHEVGLHTHPSPTLDFYSRPLFRLSRTAQVEVLSWGADLIARWSGWPPTSFRAGGYALNDDTFAAMDEVGIAVDSSCFFPSPNNHNTRRTVNAVAANEELIEVPITTVLRVDADGTLGHRKLDLDWLSVEELSSALALLGWHGAGFAMFMMHSFSFIDKRTRIPGELPSPRARFVSEVDSDRYVEVYGPKPEMRSAFAAFLDQITSEPSIAVRTLRDALPDLSDNPVSADVIPVVSRGSPHQ